jgi:hypothetical protein
VAAPNLNCIKGDSAKNSFSLFNKPDNFEQAMQHEGAARMDFANYLGHRLNNLHNEANL